MSSRASMIAAGLALLVAAPVAGPAWAQEAQPAAQAQKQAELEKKLLEVGKPAPDFSLPLLGGGEAALANLLKFGKAVLVVFWGTEEDKGGPDLPKVQKLQHELGEKGLTTVTVNPHDDADDLKDWVKEEKIELQVCIDGKETNRAVTNVYKAKTLPAFYLLDPSGKVLWRAAAYREAELREVLGKAGVK